MLGNDFDKTFVLAFYNFLLKINCDRESRGCLCGNGKPSFLPLHIFNWRSFSRRVTARWWRQWAKNEVLTNQNSRNRSCQIVRRTIWNMLILNVCSFQKKMLPNLTVLLIDKNVFLKLKLAEIYPWHIKYFERGLSRSLKKRNFIFSFEPSPFQ